jgi:hypothetical protein
MAFQNVAVRFLPRFQTRNDPLAVFLVNGP